jgi:hypothetical protein
VAAGWNSMLAPQKVTIFYLKSWWDGLFHNRGILAI